MSEIGGYRSPVNLGLGQTPMTQDPELFDEFSDVYNAIHLLNQYLDQLRLVAAGGGSGQTPAETLPFNRFFVGKALDKITAGQVVSPAAFTLGINGMILGPLPDGYDSTIPNSNFAGIALTDAEIGEDFRVGVGPAVLEVPGATSGSYIWTYSSLDKLGHRAGDGILYLNKPAPKATNGSTVYPIKVGIAVTDDFVLFGRFLRTPFSTD